MEKYISGIHNYCDRWCDRCPLTHRCSIFESSANHSNDDHSDFDAISFTENLSENLEKAMDMIRDSIEKHGLDWTTFHKEAVQQELVEPELTRMQQTVKDRAIQYGIEVKKWFDQNKEWLEDKEDEMNTKTNLGIDQNKLFKTLSDAIETIQWYNFFIGPKMSRAIRGLHDEFIAPETPIQNDANGSAKITMIAINRSLAAWETLRFHFPERTDDLLDLFRSLAWLRRETLKLFPQVDDFVRPGFDERVLEEAGK